MSYTPLSDGSRSIQMVYHLMKAERGRWPTYEYVLAWFHRYELILQTFKQDVWWNPYVSRKTAKIMCLFFIAHRAQSTHCTVRNTSSCTGLNCRWDKWGGGGGTVCKMFNWRINIRQKFQQNSHAKSMAFSSNTLFNTTLSIQKRLREI